MEGHVSDDQAPSLLFVGNHPLQHDNVERSGAALARLADRLLEIGGESLIVPIDNPVLVEAVVPLLLRVGHAFDASRAILEPGEPSECRANSVRLWSAGRGTICTGYALSGGMWRSHTWVEDRRGRVIETTGLRDAYFGYELDAQGAEMFAGLV